MAAKAITTYGKPVGQLAEVVFNNGKTLFVDIQQLVDLGKIEQDFAVIIMKTIDEIQNLNKALSAEDQEKFCSWISTLFQKLCGIFPSCEASLQQSANTCKALINQQKLTELKIHLADVLKEQKTQIISKEISFETMSLVMSVFGLLDNIHHMLSSLGTVRMENEVQMQRFQKKLQTQTSRFEKIESFVSGSEPKDVSHLLPLLIPILEDLEDLVSDIQIKTDQQQSTRNSYYTSALGSAFRLGVTVVRGFFLQEYFTVADWTLLGAAGLAHVACGGTSYYIGSQYATEVQRFMFLLLSAKTFQMNAQECMQNLSKVKKDA